MGIVRNSIDVVGITDSKDLPTEITNGHYVQYSETETFFIPRYKSSIKRIFKAVINIETNSKREIKTPFGKTIVIDGIKNIKVIYSEKAHSSKANSVDIKVPFNTFTELEDDIDIEEVNVYVIDAYFSLVENRKLYSHLVYMVEFIYKDSLEEREDDFKDNSELISNEDFVPEDNEEEYKDEYEVQEEEYSEDNYVLENIIKGNDYDVDETEQTDEIEFDINNIEEYEAEISPVIEDIPRKSFIETNLVKSGNKRKRKNKEKDKRREENELAQDIQEYDCCSEFDCEYL